MPRSSTTVPEHGPTSPPQNSKPPAFVKKIKVFMYNFGSPKVGNGIFANFYDKMVPCSYRVVVDGDIVAALPPQSKYSHIGTEILIDSVGAGSIIIDPSFVERWLRTHMKSSVAVHSLLVYRKGLLGIKLAAEFMRANANARDTVDPLRLALKVRTHHQVNSILDEDAGIAADLVTADQEDEPSPAVRESRDDSVSDVMEARVGPCKDKDLEGSAASSIDLEILSPVSEPDASTASKQLNSRTEVVNPILKGISGRPVISRRVSATDSTVVDHDHAALHYAHDLENMEALRSQMAAMRTPGPVKWIQEAANRRMQREGGSSKSGKMSSGEGVDGESASPSSSKANKALLSSPSPNKDCNDIV